ncbi:MAG: hypothetical protein SWY16_12685, partial [Cyanobacteriota bacterium]|nr:hypothetical protein [Cyanobacteriota bacterium]
MRAFLIFNFAFTLPQLPFPPFPPFLPSPRHRVPASPRHRVFPPPSPPSAPVSPVSPLSASPRPRVTASPRLSPSLTSLSSRFPR